MSIFVMILLSFAIIAGLALCLFVGIMLLGKPLVKGCGKEDCCHKKNCENKQQNLHSQHSEKK